MNQSEKIRALQLANHGVAFIGVAYITYAGLWSTLWLALIGSVIFLVLGINIGYHRYLTHASFNTHPIISNTCILIGSLCLVGSPLAWSISHINHHAYADHDGDPHSPTRIKFWDFFMTRFEPVKHHRLGAKTLMRNKLAPLLHQHYFIPIIIYCAILFVINPLYVVLLWSIPSLAALYLIMILSWYCHKDGGYVNTQIKDQSKNNFLAAILTFGEGWHNNHHADPRAWNFQKRWWEIDPTSWVIRLIKTDS